MLRPRLLGRLLMWSGFLIMMVLAAPFVVHAVARGLSVADPAEMARSRLFHANAGTVNLAMYGHMVVGGVLTALAPLQMLGWVRRRAPRVHHLIGYTVAGLAVLTGAGGLIYIAAKGTIGGPLMSAGFAVYGILLIGTAVRTVQLARRRDPTHGAWAGRFIILALASWFFRVQYGLWDLTFGGWATTPNFRGGFDQVMTFGFYLPWLAVYEGVRWWRAKG